MSSQANAKISPPGGLVTELVARAAAGDGDAFATLYNEFQPHVYRYLFARTRNRHLAEDLTSETFVRVLRRIDTFTALPSGSFAGWLVTVARNIHADHCKARRTRLEILTGDFFDADERLDSAETGALRELEAIEATQVIAMAMTALNPLQRKCVQLRYLDELSLAEAASQLGKSYGAVKTLTNRAMHTMQRALTDQAVAV